MAKDRKAVRRTSKKTGNPAAARQAMSNSELFGKLRRNGVKVKTGVVGRGLTRRTAYKTSLDTLFEFDQKTQQLHMAPLSEDALIRGTLSIEEIYGRIELAMRETLREAGFPDSDSLIVLGKRGSWKWRRDGDNSTRFIRRGLDLPLEKIDSRAWYAAAQLRALDVVRSTPLRVSSESRSNVLIVVNSAFELGRLVERSFWKFQHEAAAQTTYRSAKKLKKVGARGAKSNKNSADKRKSFVLEEAKRILDARPLLSPAAVAAIILRKRPKELELENGAGLCAASTVEVYIRAFKKSGKL